MQKAMKEAVNGVIMEAGHVSEVMAATTSNMADLNAQIEEVSATTEGCLPAWKRQQRPHRK